MSFFDAALGAFGCALFLAGCSKSVDAPTAEPAAFLRTGAQVTIPDGSPLRKTVHVDTVVRREVRPHLAVPATVEAEPSRMAKIAPPLAGRIGRLHVKFGDEVKAGAPLFDLHAPEMVAAQSDRLRAQSALAHAERVLARQRDLAEHGIAARREVEQAETDRELAKSELDRTDMRLQILGGGHGYRGGSVTVTSPIAGRVVDLSCAPGEFRNDSTAPVMVVVDLSRVWVTASVQERDIRLVHTGDDAAASFIAYPGETFPGRVLLVGDLLEPDTRTIKVRVAFDNPAQRLKPGMFATVTFMAAPQTSVVVPAPALVLAGDQTYAFLEVAPWSFERRAVAVGEQRGGDAILTQGLEAGSRIIVEGAVFLQ